MSMSYEEALAYIHGVSWTKCERGLFRIRELMRRLGDPQKALRFVHIGGTNGKGSTAALTASVLRKAGYTAGLYTSPYIYRFNERIQVNGVPIPDEDLIRLTERVRKEADAMAKHPSEFEIVTAIGFLYFFECRCDIVVAEVGLGGEFDATNVIDAPLAAVLTNIGLDHTQILGDTVEKIAATKAGIIKPGSSAVLYHQSESVEDVIRKDCARKGVPLTVAGADALTPLSHSLEGQRFLAPGIGEMTMPLLGAHQLRNAAVVLEIIRLLRGKGYSIREEDIREGFRDVYWPGRFEVFSREPLFIADGGHNPQCLDALRDALGSYLPKDQKAVFLIGCMADKDYSDMFVKLKPFASCFVTVTVNNPRALASGELAGLLTPAGIPVYSCGPVAEGVKKAVELAGKDGTVISCGSLYMLAEVKAGLDQNKQNN